MSVNIQIDDGDPWYFSPDIWVVPGNDPNGSPGVPTAGQSAYVWARIHNRGTDAVDDIPIQFWWGDPSTAITPNTATPIGTSYVTLLPGETAEVLCLTPWRVSWANGGHECLIVEAYAAADPAFPMNPNDPFDPQSDPHMAQLNLNVLPSIGGMLVFPFVAANALRLDPESITLRVRRDRIDLLKAVQSHLGLQNLPSELPGQAEFGLRPYRCGDPIDDVGKTEVTIPLKTNTRVGMALICRVPEDAEEGRGALLLIEQFFRDKAVGGIGVLVVKEKQGD
jgi:hypothetical protein